MLSPVYNSYMDGPLIAAYTHRRSGSVRCMRVPRTLARITAGSGAYWTPPQVSSVLIQICFSPSSAARRPMPPMQVATRLSGVLPRDSLHRFGRCVVRNYRVGVHRTRHRLAFAWMAIRPCSGFHRSINHPSGVSSEVGASRRGEHLVEADVKSS